MHANSRNNLENKSIAIYIYCNLYLYQNIKKKKNQRQDFKVEFSNNFVKFIGLNIYYH